MAKYIARTTESERKKIFKFTALIKGSFRLQIMSGFGDNHCIVMDESFNIRTADHKEFKKVNSSGKEICKILRTKLQSSPMHPFVKVKINSLDEIMPIATAIEKFHKKNFKTDMNSFVKKLKLEPIGPRYLYFRVHGDVSMSIGRLQMTFKDCIAKEMTAEELVFELEKHTNA